MLNLALWVVQVATAYLFLYQGSTQLVGTPKMVAEFAALGAGQWLRSFTGALEITGSFLLVIRGREAAGGTLLGLLAASALAAHLFLIGGSPPPAAGPLPASALLGPRPRGP